MVMVEFDPGSLLRMVDFYRPTWFNLVPTMHMAVLSRLGDRQNVFSESSLRYVRSSSANLTATLRQRIGRAYGVRVVDSYAATECSVIASSGLRASEYRAGSVGLPVHDGVVSPIAVGIATNEGDDKTAA